MKKIIANQNGFSGNILIALAAIIIAVTASVTFMAIIEADTNNVTIMHDKMQQDFFARSEIKRISIMLSRSTNYTKISDRTIEMVNDDRIATYYVKLRSSTVTLNSFLGQATKQAISVRALIREKRARNLFKGDYSPVRRFIEKLSNKESLAQYQYFSDTEKSDISDNDPLGDQAARVNFWGKDELFGKVHSNSDIWIQNAGSPAVNPDAPGWPLFHAQVTTAGHFKENSSGTNLIGSSAPIDNIFVAEDPAYIEEVDPIIYEPTATLIKNNGTKPFGLNPEVHKNKIFKLKINGTSISVKEVNFQAVRTDTFVVYKKYPDALHPVQFGNTATYIKDSLWTNTISFRDTIWTDLGGLATGNSSMYIAGKVWVEGVLARKFTLGTGADAYITGDITYAGTEVGVAPDDETAPNRSDYFGLVSEGKIIIKYKYRMKNESGAYETFANTSIGPNGHVYLYGAYAAIGGNGDGPEGYRQAGTFTYEYQHPHGAVMPYRGKSQKTNADTLYKYIDFHRHKFIPTGSGGSPLWTRWPGSATASHGFPNPPTNYGDYTSANTAPLYNTSDWPWYNPVWPEKDSGPSPANINTDITWERGILHVFGAIAQRRRGFVHRSGNGGASNPDVGVWNMPYVFGPIHNTNGYGSTGYDKDYHYDNRFMLDQPPDYPEIYRGSNGGILTAFEDTSWDFKVPPTNNVMF